jgi:hypothetical protein
MTSITWNGAPEDPDSIEQFGATFVKGKPTKFEGTPEQLRKLKGNPWFSEGKADKDDPVPTVNHQVGEAAVGERVTVREPALAIKQGFQGKWHLVGADGSKSDPMSKSDAEAAFEAAKQAMPAIVQDASGHTGADNTATREVGGKTPSDGVPTR